MAKESEKKKVQNSKNLKPFKKGQSGNLKGAPKGERLSTILKGLMEVDFKAKSKLTKKEETKTLAEWVCHKLIYTALAGKTKAINIIFDRTEGKVPDNINMKIDESASIEAIKEKMHLYLKRNQRNEKEK